MLPWGKMRLAPVVLVVLSACKGGEPSEKDQLETYAKAANGAIKELAALTPKIFPKPVKGEAMTTMMLYQEAVATCVAAVEPMQRLAKVPPAWEYDLIPTIAKGFGEITIKYSCPEYELRGKSMMDAPERFKTCLDACTKDWTKLSKEIDERRIKGKQLGVAVELLPLAPDKM